MTKHERRPTSGDESTDIRAITKAMDPNWTGCKPIFPDPLLAVGPHGENLLDALIAEANEESSGDQNEA